MFRGWSGHILRDHKIGQLEEIRKTPKRRQDPKKSYIALPSNKSEGNIEFPLVAAAVLPTRPVQVLGEVDEAGQLLQLAVDQVFRTSEASDSRKESQHLSTS